MLELVKKGVKEWLLTLSSKDSFLSSKRLERFLFTSVSTGAVIACVVYEIVKDKLTATETTILILPLLTAAGYNLHKSQKEKTQGESLRPLPANEENLHRNTEAEKKPRGQLEFHLETAKNFFESSFIPLLYDLLGFLISQNQSSRRKQ